MSNALRALGLAAALSALAAPAASAYAVGPTPGVSVSRNGTLLQVQLTGQAEAALRVRAGYAVGAVCRKAPSLPPLALAAFRVQDVTAAYGDDGELGIDGSATVDLTYLDARRAVDSCQITLASPHHATRMSSAYAALTPAGATAIDETTATDALRAALVRGRGATGRYAPAAQVPGVTPLASSDAPAPPAGQVGWFAAGDTALAATTSAAGRRLFIRADGDEVETNLFLYSERLVFPDGSPVASADAGASAATARAAAARSTRPRYDRDEPQDVLDGVRVTRRGAKVTFRFTGASAFARRDVRGRRLDVRCVTVPDPAPAPFGRFDLRALVRSVRGGSVRVPSRGDGPITARLRHAGGDLCFLRDDYAPVAVGGVTSAGRRVAETLATLMDLVDVANTLPAEQPGGQAYRAAAQVAAESRRTVVALTTPGQRVPVGRVGFWSDAGTHAVLAATTRSGRRIVFADEGGGVVRTNIIGTGPLLYVESAGAFV